MALFLSCPPSFPLVKSSPLNAKPFAPSSQLSKSVHFSRRFEVKACFFNPTQDPVIKEALKEPVAFLGGVFAGLLRLNLNEDPLREWIAKTVEATGASEEEQDSSSQQEQQGECPQQIEIE